VLVKTLQRRRSPRIPWGFRRESSGGTTSRSTRATKLKIQEFVEDKEDRDPQPLDLIQKNPSAIRSDRSCTRFTIRKSQGEISTERGSSDLNIDKKSTLKRRTGLSRQIRAHGPTTLGSRRTFTVFKSARRFGCGNGDNGHMGQEPNQES
jgi:hypothetical protein